MKRLAFKMKLKAGYEAEYQKRHEQLWPELRDLLKSKGIEDYSIFLDRATFDLIGVLKIADEQLLDELPAEAVMKKWWAYMSDIMEVNPDNSPVSIKLDEVFYLP